MTFGFFASHVPVERRVEQTLLLWDRIIGFDDLELLPILAADDSGARHSQAVDASQGILLASMASSMPPCLGSLHVKVVAIAIIALIVLCTPGSSWISTVLFICSPQSTSSSLEMHAKYKKISSSTNVIRRQYM